MAALIRYSIIFLASSAIFGAEHYGHVLSGKRPIPGATVTATQEDTRLVTTTDESGYYSFPDFKKGRWTFHVEMFGFQPVNKEVTIYLEPSLQDFDLELEASGTEVPPPTATPAGFQVVNVKEQSITPDQVQPQLEAAVSPPPPETATTSGADSNQAFLVNGSLSGGLAAVQQSDFFDQLDDSGPSLKKPKKAKGDTAGISKRAKKAAKRARKKKQTNATTVASFGATKQESQIKGSVYFGLRNSEADARPYSLSGQPIAKPGYAQSRFGVAAGGPLDFPRLIHSSNTFFFLSYAGVRSKNPYANIDTVPTPAERAGDFSQPIASGPLVLYDPISHLPLFGNQIPSNRMDKQSVALLPYIPLPNLPGGVQNYQYVTAIPQNTDDFSVKLNNTFSDKNRFSLSFNLQNRNEGQAQLYGFEDKLDGLGWQTDLGWTHNFNSRTINSVHWAFSRNRFNTTPFFAYGSNVAANIGIKGTSPDPVNYGPPNLNFSNFGDMIDGTFLVKRQQTSAVRDSLTVVRGAHNLTLGGEYRRMQINSITDSNGRGSFIFSGLLTSKFDANGLPVANTGFDFADFLFGFPHSGKIRYGTASNYFRGSAYSAYATDDWKVLPNFTLTYGLRYEYFTPFAEKYDRMSNLDLAPGITGAAAVLPNQAGPYTGTFPRALIDSDSKNLSPRGAFAWRPLPKHHLVIRGGYSIFYNGSIYTDLPSRLASQPPFAQVTTLLASLDFPLRIATGFTQGNQKSINNSFAIDRGYRDGYAQTWNFAVEQTLNKTWVLELGYLGTKGTRLDIQGLPNRALPGSPLTAEDRRLIGNAVGFTYETSNGNSILHAAQVRLTRRLHKGGSLNALYTFSKSIDDASTIGGGSAVLVQDYGNLAAERGLSSFDMRHSLTLGFTEQSPVGRASLFAGNAAAVRILSSWRLAGIITASSGLPYTARVFGNLADASGSGNLGSSRADATGLPVAGGNFFNPAAFTLPPSGRFGDAGRNTIPGPSRFAMNLSLSRSFHMTERYHLEIRLDAYNSTNTPIFTNFGTVLNSLNYQLATSAMPMRTLRANVRLKF